MKFRTTLFVAFLTLSLTACERQKASEPVNGSLQLLESRPDVWARMVDPSDPPKFRERVFWADDDDFSGVELVDDTFLVEPTSPLAALEGTDVLVTDWEDGYWLQVEEVMDTGAGRLVIHVGAANIGDILSSGRLVAIPESEETSLANALTACSRNRCAAEVDLSFDAPGALARTEPGSSLSVSATKARLRFRPTIRYEEGVDRERGEFTRMRVSGKYTYDGAFEIAANQPSSMRVSFPLPNPGADQASIPWASKRSPAILEPEAPRVPASVVAETISAMPGITSRILPGPQLEITASEGSVYMEFDQYDGDDEINPTGGIRLDELVVALNQQFAGTPLKAYLIQGTGGYSATFMFIRPDRENFARFQLLGQWFEARPDLNVGLSVSAPSEGSISNDFRFEGRVEGGWLCYDDRCQFDGSKVGPTARSSMTSTVTSGTPWTDFRFLLRPEVIIKRGAANFSKIEPATLVARTEFQTTPPTCPNRSLMTMSHFSRRLGLGLYTDDSELLEAKGFSSDVEGCTGTGDPPADCSICEVGSDPNCVTDVCGPDSACYFGRCSVPAEFDISLTWDYSDPNVDLDLWVQLPDGELINSQNLEVGPASLTNMSDGAVSTSSQETAGKCEGEWDRNCNGQPAVDGTCPPTCLVLRKTTEDQGSCYAEPLECKDYWRRYFDCPSECQNYCDPTIDYDCDTFCSDDYNRVSCWECSGKARIDLNGCTEKGSKSGCEGTDGCFWQSRFAEGDAFCVGGRVRCDLLPVEKCEDVPNCDWVEPPPVERLEFPPYVERVIFRRQMDRPLKFWVVNKSGIEPDEQIPFSIRVRLRPEVDYELQGFVGPNAADRSIQYRYELGDQ